MLTLSEGGSSIVVAPEYGGGLLGWLDGPAAVLRRALPKAVMGDSNAMACFPLVPYANRIGFGHLTWEGRSYALAHNFGDHPHTIHGIGWQRAWAVTQVSRSAVSLALSHAGDAAWPFAFDATVGYALAGPTLTVALAVTNRHALAAPAGLGIHPYFPKRSGAAVRFDANGAWENGPDALPARHGPVPAAWSHSRPLPVAGSRLDNCFTGWNRTVEIDAGPGSLLIEASAAFGDLQVFTPSWAEFFCVEPVTHTPDAINRPGLSPDQAMASLAPGETLAGSIRLTLTRPIG
jgi:aldose 1-epimerase